MERIEELENRRNEIGMEWIEKCAEEHRKPFFGITRKMAGIIYRNFKLGNISLTKEEVSSLYDEADVYYKSERYNRDHITVDYYCDAFQATLKGEFKVAEYCLKRACHWCED